MTIFNQHKEEAENIDNSVSYETSYCPFVDGSISNGHDF